MNAPTAATLRPFAPERRRIAIIGGGFSGAVVALNLLKTLPKTAAAITVIEPRGMLGAGLAYSTLDPAHRVNVPASRMPVLANAPDGFNNWLKGSGALDADPAAVLDEGRIYPQRHLFGTYVDGLLRQAATVPQAPEFLHLKARAETVQEADAVFTIRLDSGAAVMADIVVLCVSHPPPAVPEPLRTVARHPKFIADPWADDVRARIDAADRVLIIGTALTTADIVSTLHHGGHRGGITAFSRRGLLSRQREVMPTQPFGDFKTQPNRTALALLQHVRRTIRQAATAFSCWEAVMERIRAEGMEIWAALPDAERARFLRHLRVFWDAHRYQLAPQPAAILHGKCADGSLRFRAARLRSAAWEDGCFQIALRERGAAENKTQTESFDAVVNCTGPDHANVLASNPALASLTQAGLVTADAFGLGMRTDTSGRAIGLNGVRNERLFVGGPLARAAFGELMGVPQVAVQAALVADRIAALLRAVPAYGPSHAPKSGRGAAPGSPS